MSPAKNDVSTFLVPLLLKRKGVSDEIFYAARCRACGKPILDFRNANVSTVGETDDKPKRIGKLGDAEVFLIPSDGAFVFCKQCDRSENKPWVDADCVFQSDQRHRFER